MRDRADDLLRAFGIAQGLSLLLITLGGGAILAAILGGLMATALTLPGWAVALATVGAFMLSAGALARIAARLRPASSAFASVIDSGVRLRKKLMDEQATDDEAKDRWKLRLDDWMAEADQVVRDVAPHRYGAYKLDHIITDYPSPRDMPEWKRELLSAFDDTIDRLSVLRATL